MNSSFSNNGIMAFDEVLDEGCQVTQLCPGMLSFNDGQDICNIGDEMTILLPCLRENQILTSNAKQQNLIQLTYASQQCRIATVGFIMQYGQISKDSLYTDLVYLHAHLKADCYSEWHYSIRRAYCVLTPDLWDKDYQFIQNELLCFQISQEIFTNILDNFLLLSGFELQSKWNLTDLRKRCLSKNKNHVVNFTEFSALASFTTYTMSLALYSNQLFVEFVESGVYYSNTCKHYFAKCDILSFFKFIKHASVQIAREELIGQNIDNAMHPDFKLHHVIFNIALQKRNRKRTKQRQKETKKQQE